MTAREDAEQATLMSWAAMQKGKYPELELLFHIPNGGRRNAAEAARFKAEGVKAGVPDLFLPVARNGLHGLWIEMKRREGGRVSEHQSEWIERLRVQGYAVEVCYGWQEASKVLTEYLCGRYESPQSPAETAPLDKQVEPKRKGFKKHGFNFEEWMKEND